jgi:hypothetical protein
MLASHSFITRCQPGGKVVGPAWRVTNGLQVASLPSTELMHETAKSPFAKTQTIYSTNKLR